MARATSRWCRPTAVRIGAHEQIHMLGRLLGVTAYTIDDVAELPELLDQLREQPPRADRHRGLEPARSAISRATRALATASDRHRNVAGAVRPAARPAPSKKPCSASRWRSRRPACSPRWTRRRAWAACCRRWSAHKLPLAYVSDGQRVPEDLQPGARASAGARAVEIASRKRARPRTTKIMQRRIGAGAHAMA